MNNRVRLLSILLCLLLLISTGCAQNSGVNTVVANVNGEAIYRWEVDLLYEQNKAQYTAASGLDLDAKENFKSQKEFREKMLESLIKDAAFKQKASDMGYSLTQAEKDEIKAKLDELAERNIQDILDKSYGSDEAYRDKAKADWEQRLKDNNLTYDFLLNNEYKSKLHEKLAQELYKDVKVSEDELKGTYDKMVSDSKTKYSEDPTAYASDAATPGRIAYNPAGYVRVKYIMITLPEDIKAQIDELNKKQTDILSEMFTLASEKGETTVDTSETDGITKQIQQLQSQGHEKIKQTAQQVFDELSDGQDFDTLLEQYGQDPTMQQYPANQYGVLVSQANDYDKPFIQAALALENAGDTSGLIEIGNGYAILQLVEKVQEGAVLFEQMRDFIEELSMTSPVIAIYEEFSAQAVAEYTKAGKIEVFNNRL